MRQVAVSAVVENSKSTSYALDLFSRLFLKFQIFSRVSHDMLNNSSQPITPLPLQEPGPRPLLHGFREWVVGVTSNLQ
jgi:hypothetical protein